jgi:chromosome segregation ATPase
MADESASPLDDLAQAIERARYENMATAKWNDLRDGERAARTDLMRRSLQSAGITAALEDLKGRAARSDELAGLADERARAMAAQRAEHEAAVRELTAVTTQLRQDLADARADIEAADDRAQAEAVVTTQLRQELAGAEAAIAVAHERAERAESLLAAVRSVLGEKADGSSAAGSAAANDPTSPLADNHAPAHADPAGNMRPAARNPFGRSARSS